MKTVYLDQNIYIHLLMETIDKDKVKDYLITHKAKYLYSPAHIEEVYLASLGSADEHYAEKMLSVIENISQCKEAKPTLNGGVQIVYERPQVCYQRVEGFDTTQMVEQDSYQKYSEDRARFAKLVDIDKHNQSISNINPSEIWSNDVIQQRIEQLNIDRENIINSFNSRPDVQLLSLIGIDKKLPEDFSFEPNQFSSRLQKSYKELEYTVETLMRVLNNCGYNAEKKEKTIVSSTHDVTHCIYGTVSDLFITMDKRFSLKCEAVYKYIGVRTKVVYCSKPENVIEALAKYLG